MDDLHFMAEQNFGVFYRPLVKPLGLSCSVFLSELVNKRAYHRTRNEEISSPIHGDGWIYQTIDVIHDRTGLSRDEQDRCIKKLISMGLIEMQLIGLPARRHFRIYDQRVLDLIRRISDPSDPICGKTAIKFAGNPQTVLLVSRKLCCGKPANRAQEDIHSRREERRKEGRKNTPPIPPTGEAAVAACVSFFSDTPEIEKSNPETQNPTHKTNTDASNSHRKDPPFTQKQKGGPREGKTVDIERKGPLNEFLKFGTFVRLKPSDHSGLCQQYGTALVDELIVEMDDYCAASRPKGYRDYAAALRQWIRRRKNTTNNSSPTGYKNESPAQIRQNIRAAARQRWIDSNGDPTTTFTNILEF